MRHVKMFRLAHGHRARKAVELVYQHEMLRQQLDVKSSVRFVYARIDAVKIS